ncbi:shikimate kinase [Persicitalea sp.]|uniref:shikimate kinase n=1 Tax=Persicitalea sp. TaxID=3100273 RepID=UPI0035947A10
MKNVFLVGMPSSGKSTLGRRLARALKYQFVDLDKLIVADQKRSIPEIFKAEGEDYFRKVEKSALQAIQPNQKTVVATGGGAPCFFDNMCFIKANGLSVFINISPSLLAARILNHDKDDRPLLSEFKAKDLEKELSRRLTDRLPFYSQADLSISEKTSIQEIVALLVPLL